MVANGSGSESLPQQFMRALQQIEQSGDVEPLVRLFAPDAELGGLGRSGPYHGTDGARQFWREYMAAFGDIRSEFPHATECDRSAALEWKSDGTLPDGHPISYRGVSLIEFADGKVKRFYTYYDTAAFLPQGAKLAGEHQAV